MSVWPAFSDRKFCAAWAFFLFFWLLTSRSCFIPEPLVLLEYVHFIYVFQLFSTCLRLSMIRDGLVSQRHLNLV